VSERTERTDSGSGEPATPPVPGTGQPLVRERVREAYFDNARFLAVVLVVAGHAWEPLRGWRPVDAAHLFVYAFHLPVFVLVAGYLGGGLARSRARLLRLVTALALPYLIFDAGYALFAALAGGRRFVWSPLHPYYLTWFLLALLVWRLSVPLWRRLRRPLPAAVLVSVAAGAVTLPATMAADRVVALLPFFVLGMRLRPDHFAALRRPPVRAAASAVLAAALLGAYLLAGRLDPEWFHWRRGYGQLGYGAAGPALLAGAALWLAVLAVAALLTAAFLALVPARRTWFTRFGSATLYAYLLHGFAVHGAVYAGWYRPAQAYGPAGAVAVTALAVALTFLLVTRPVRLATRWAVAPRPRRIWGPSAGRG
jgi:fucose 4-O-acetylase-like acetyltransferase